MTLDEIYDTWVNGNRKDAVKALFYKTNYEIQAFQKRLDEQDRGVLLVLAFGFGVTWE